MRKAFLLAGLLVAAPALAVPTPAGSFSVALPGTTAAAEPVLAGVVVSDTLVPFAFASATNPVTGTIQVRVVRGADNKLAFYWKIDNAATSKGNIETMAISGFPKLPYDANWRKDGVGTVAPTSAVAGPSVNFDWLYGFLFKTPIKPGESSRLFFLRSSATASKPAAARLQTGGGATADFAIKAPVG